MTKQEKLKKSKLINLLKNNNNTNLDELLNNNNISTLILELLSLDEFIEYNLPLYRYSGDKIKITKNNIKNLFERGYFNDTDFFEKKSDKEQNIKMEILYYLYNEHKKTIEEYIQNSNNVSEDIKKIIYCLDEIKSNPNNVSKYLHNDSIVNKYYLNYAFENGLVLSNSNLNLASDCPIYTDYKFIKKSINYDYTNIIHANFDDRKMKRLLKIAKDNKFDFSYDNLSKFNKDCNAFSCEEFMKEAINYDCNNIIYSKRVTNSLIKYSIEKGFDFSYDNLEKLFDKSNNIFDNRIFMEKAIENDLDNICLYSGVFLSENIINKIIDNFDFSYENLSKIYEFNYNNYLFLSKEIMQKAIEFNNDNIKFCILHDYNFYKNEIIEKKLKISPEILQELGRILKESYMNLGEEKDLIEANPNNIIMIACSYRYEDDLKQYFEYAVDNGVDLSYEKLRFIPEFVFDSMDDNNVKKLIEKDVNNILLYKGSSDEVFKYAVEKGFKFTRENLLKLGENSKIFSIDAFKYAIEEDVNNILLYKGSSDEVFKYAVEKGFKFTRENLLKLGENSKIFSIDAFKYAIEEDVNNILLYKGSSDEVFKYAMEKGFKFTRENLLKLGENSKIFSIDAFKYAIEEDVNNILLYKGSSDEVFKYAIEKGFILTYDNLNSLASKDILLNSEMLMDIAIKHDIKNLLEYNGNLLKFNFLKEKLKLSDNKNIEELIKKYEKKYNEYSDILTNYSGDRLKFLLNEETFNSFLEKIGFNKDTFIQYNFGVDYDFLTDIIQISKNSENLETFCSFINDMSKYYDDNVFDKSKMLITLLKNYNRYPELCENIEKNNIDLSDVQFSQLSKLFKNKIEINNINISKISDLEKIDEILMDKFQKNYDNSHDISEKIDNLCKIIFGYSNQEIEEMLQKYGNTARLKQLMFDNRYDEKIKSKIELYLGYTAAFEMLLNEKNIENLDYLFENIKKNSDVIFEINSLFEDYQEEMRKLYAYETNENLTKKDYIDDAYLETMIDKEKSEKYGVNVYDYSNKNYILLAHVMSGSESVDQIVNGLSKNGDSIQNYICLSAISYIKQNYYYGGGKNIIFGYDTLPIENFIVSSPNNMGSNRAIKRNDISTPNIKTKQYGVRDTSNTNGNSEYLCLREGLKPCCIILPNGREATDEEISIAKEYGLYFVKTQEKDVSLKSSPEEIKYKSKTTIEKEKYDEMSSKISQLQKLMSKKSPRKIAIFTDSHGLYEPTLEALEDARKDGVTEIYSLGDNIGTGSNPGEVIDLLEEYNVKSLKGNHEIYALDGIDSMSGHLSSDAMKEEAKKNSDWTKSKLTSEQIEEIRKCPEELEIEIGGKKVLLCHHTKDYNTGKEKYDTDKYDDVFQGHEHFESGNKNIHTVRAVGMGYSSYDPKGIASYIELVEKPDGNGYDIIKRTVNYSLERSKREIDESDAPSEDKEKISNWIR